MNNEITAANAVPFSVHMWLIDAAELGLAPGVFPLSLTTNLGNGLPFYRGQPNHDGSMNYRQQFGCLTLRVLNT